MAVGLHDSLPVFRDALTQCEQELSTQVDWSLLDVLRCAEGAPSIDRVDVMQPALFAVMYGLAEAWRWYGVEPDFVVGASMGEVPAACVAGALSMADGIRVTTAWSRAQRVLVGRGDMASVLLPADRVQGRLPAGVVIATVNGPGSTVVAGEPAAIEELVQRFTAEGVRARKIPIGLAAHSAHFTELREALHRDLATIEPRPARIPFYASTVGGLLPPDTLLDAEYWCRNGEGLVRFEEAVRAVAAAVEDPVLVELSPHPTLVMPVRETLDAIGGAGSAVGGSLRRGEGGLDRFTTSVADLYTRLRGRSGDRAVLAERIAGHPAPEQRRLVLDLVCGVASSLGRSDAVQPGSTFRELGFDSLAAVEFHKALAEASGLSLPVTLVFDHPTPAAIADHLLAEMHGGADAETVVAREPLPLDEPIAIIGMSCRAAGGVHSPEQLWQLVSRGGDAISEFPTDRGWNTRSLYDPEGVRTGTSYVRHGGFLHDAGYFDNGLFGIGPREAAAMDPQQRLLLESCWELFERAGMNPRALEDGHSTGVFLGAMVQDYGPRLYAAPEHAAGYLLTGTLGSVSSGRIAYNFGLGGPAVTVDTACSSSLVALHQACQALRLGDCSLAVAGGATVMANPGLFVEFSRQRGLAPDGRCKPFGAGADGTAWGEGVGLLLVERLSDAERNGHQVLAVIRGSAINQDGASNGLAAPNGRAQQRVVRQALANARLAPGQVDAVEAHGTGTALGDPIEARALLASYGQDRERPLWLGSLKSNIGHTQAASGVLGVIKMVEAIRHGELPRTVHVDELSPYVDWSAGDVRVLTENRPWPETGEPRRAGVSSFGLSGTNAHLILEQAPPRPEPEPAEAGPVPWVLSAQTPEALRAQAGQLLTRLTERPEPVAEVGRTLTAARAVLEHRAVVIGREREELLDGLRELVGGRPPVAHGVPAEGKLAVLFSGQGSQQLGMGRSLYRASPVFAEALDAVCAELDPVLPRPLKEVLFDELELLHRTDFAQAGLFAVQVALFRLAEHLGTAPDFVAGHSIGEIAAAHVAGVLPLADACRLVAARGALMAALPPGGAMAAIAAPEAEVARTLGPDTALAAVNGPAAVVVSGAEAEVERIAALWRERGHKATRLTVSHAFHSPLMAPMMEEFRAVLDGLTFSPPSIGTVAELHSPEYWLRHVQDTVRFADGVSALHEAGVRTFLELGPDSVLTAIGPDCLAGDPDAAFIAAGRRGHDEVTTFLEAMARAFVRGSAIAWDRWLPSGGRMAELPTYPFQRAHYWLAAGDEPSPSTTASTPWQYQESWRLLAEPADTGLHGVWLVVGHDRAPTRACAGALERAGAQVRLVEPDPGSGRSGPALAVRSALGDVPAVAGVLALPDGDVGATVLLVQALSDAGVTAPLWCVTQGAVGIDGSDPLDRPDQAQLWGLGRVAALEQPRSWGGLVDLPAEPDGDALRRLVRVLADSRGEDQLAVRPTGLWGRRLVPAEPAPTGADRVWGCTGTVLITGGTGALGGHVARRLAARGAEHLLLVGRRGADAPGARELSAELETLGARVTVEACDTADRAAVAALLARIPAEYPLTAVVHAAGISDFTELTATTVAEVDAVLAAKVAGAAHLDELLGEQPLDAFLLFSSIAATWGSATNGAYAAANAYLDALARQRRQRGLTATSVAWGMWAGGGMGEGDIGEKLARTGLRAMAPDAALAELDAAVRRDEAALTVADVDWQRFAPLFTGERRSPLLSGVPAAVEALRDEPAAAGGAVPTSARAIAEAVHREVAAVLGHSGTGAVDTRKTFKELGFDSLAAVELRNRLRQALGRPLASSLVYDYPTPTALAGHLADGTAAPGAELPAAPTASADDPIVIVGMACRYPGDAGSPEMLWELATTGREGLSDFPTDRGWALGPEAEFARVGGFLRDVAGFDAGFFGISPREALAMDPQQRLLLEVSWEAFERAGIDPGSLKGSRTGVFTGLSGSDYHFRARTTDRTGRHGSEVAGHVLTGNAAGVASGRVSYTLGLEGPAVTVDTACSSSLVALHLAAQALRSGECSLALAGGVAVLTRPEAFVEFSRQGGLAGDGRVKAFADAADGTSWGEGVGVLVLERLSDAERNGHRVLAVVRGSAVNQDGASNGLTAPNGPSQQRVIRQALANARLTTTDIDAVEAHGTGTTLGDPIEAQALLATYGQDRDRPLLLGSIKSNIGHTQAAAGVAGVIKMVQAMH
ncbi:SDR family NAD(P)-dependent oxidoreductase, partial [Kitasatospora sp. NPDC057500]|uniref:SDR family NAD(P)-dependent oxidoreductase n=1 Tax=Kitasatospora sp. NPDC057500 TaxID=3346151 RepID=UPI0036C9C5E4